MEEFFGENILLSTKTAVELYKSIKDLPIIDYHCHLDQKLIKEDAKFKDIAEIWLGGDHYKWRAMRLCGVDEKYITGDAFFYEKFLAFCKIMPKLINNPLYFWSHLELKQVFDINLEINEKNAPIIYKEANEKLKDLSVRKLLKKFKVEFIATTDDPIDDLVNHGTYDETKVTPTFRGDELLTLNDTYLAKLSKVSGVDIKTLDDLEKALIIRLDYFKEHHSKVVDHGFKDFPQGIYTKEEADQAFLNKNNLSELEFSKLIGYLFTFLFKEYKKRNFLVQLHFAVTRNVNSYRYKDIGKDSGFDVMAKEADIYNLMNLLDAIEDSSRPNIVLYTLNPVTLPSLATLTGAYRNVLIGASWWFNDTNSGIRNNLNLISEYSVLGTSLGMLTDSRSFMSYSRFDFFRRILCDFVGEKVEKGEYSLESAYTLVSDIAYNNIKKMLGE